MIGNLTERWISRKRWVTIYASVFACLAGFSERIHGQADEYNAKAVLLLGIAKKFEWPAKLFSNHDSPLVIGVLGNDPFGRKLTDAFRGASVGGRPVLIRKARNVGGLGSCHMVFVCESEAGDAKAIIRSYSGKSVLLIADFSPFASLGGHLNFILKANRVKYEFNRGAAEKDGRAIPAQIQYLGIPVSGP